MPESLSASLPLGLAAAAVCHQLAAQPHADVPPLFNPKAQETGFDSCEPAAPEGGDEARLSSLTLPC